MPRTFIACHVSEGFFGSEFYVRLRNGDAYIVDRSDVRIDREPRNGTGEVDGKVLAYVVDRDEKDSKLLVELSGEPVAGGLRTWVSISDADPLQMVA